MPVATYAADHVESHGAATGCPERHLWLAVLAQAGDDLLSPNERIRQDAVAFFRGPDLLRVLDLAALDRDLAPALRARALELAEVPAEQRQPNVRLITYQGQTRSLKGWAEHSGVNVTTLSHRLRHNWSIRRALSTPGRRSPA